MECPPKRDRNMRTVGNDEAGCRRNATPARLWARQAFVAVKEAIADANRRFTTWGPADGIPFVA